MLRPNSESALHGPWSQSGASHPDTINIVCPYKGQRIVGLTVAAFYGGINYLDVRTSTLKQILRLEAKACLAL